MVVGVLLPRLLRLLKGVTHRGAHSYRSLVWDSDRLILNDWFRTTDSEQPNRKCSYLWFAVVSPTALLAPPVGAMKHLLAVSPPPVQPVHLAYPSENEHTTSRATQFSAPTAGGIGDIGPCQYLPSIAAMFAITACPARGLTRDHLRVCSLALAVLGGLGLAHPWDGCLFHYNGVTLLTLSLTIWDVPDGGLVSGEVPFVVVERRRRRSTTAIFVLVYAYITLQAVTPSVRSPRRWTSYRPLRVPH